MPVRQDFDQVDLTFDSPVDLSFDCLPPEPERKRIAADALGLPRNLRHTTRSEHRRTKDLLTTQEALAHLIRLPRPGESVHMILPGAYTQFDLLVAVQKLLARPVSILVATLSTNAGNAQRLAEMIDTGTVRRADLVVSTYFEKASPEEFAAVRDTLAPRGCRVVCRRNHAKVALVSATGAGDRYVIEGSGNLRSCNALEQATVFNDAGLFRFHDTWMRHLLTTPTA
jgi:hypothetical protein